ncbi:MAG TPA: DUF2520 domain-containing protein [Bacteroidales bacterium]|nr:DUF2520 domain-containing protein [Bacteroidales bacterium]HRZ50167.1 DUF2520 domain-containing protein [Bacteroidales bacterium]
MDPVYTGKIALIGTGNVAWHLCRLFTMAGLKVTAVLTRNRIKASGSQMASLFPVPLTDDIGELRNSADLIIIAVGDAHIPQFAKRLAGYQGYVVHTAGSCSLSVLTGASLKGGVLYPCQTLTRGRALEPDQIPFCIEASDPSLQAVLRSVVAKAGSPCFELDSRQRLKLHLAAVLACNFANHLWDRAGEFLGAAGIPFSLLHPLLAETLTKAVTLGPEAAQTGPAVRMDIDTLQKHLALLAHHQALAEIYRTVSESIIQKHTGKNVQL